MGSRYGTRPIRTPTKPTRKLPETTKLLLAALILAYFIVLGVGIYAVLRILNEYPEYSITALGTLCGYVGAPFATALGFYCWKAKNENMQKYGWTGSANTGDISG